jgi:hypothetical protein
MLVISMDDQGIATLLDRYLKVRDPTHSAREHAEVTAIGDQHIAYVAIKRPNR